MRKLATLALLPLIVLVGCNKPAPRGYADEKTNVELIRPTLIPAGAHAPPAGDAAAKAVMPLLAYRYSVSLTVPDGRVQALMSRHQQACTAAGANLCQVLESNLSTSHGVTDAMLKLRAEPGWLTRFRGGLGQDAKGVGGSLTRSSVDSEDLTRSITDTEASLRAKTTLRDRLEKLLAEHPGKMSELLEIEKQLADTQGEIDAAQSELAMMRAQVDMSTITLNYGSHADVIGSGRSRPFAEALANFGTVVSLAASVIVYGLAFALPFMVIVVPLVWWLRRRRRTRKAAMRADPPV
jgi:hypothetical protein